MYMNTYMNGENIHGLREVCMTQKLTNISTGYYPLMGCGPMWVLNVSVAMCGGLF